jgi:hypothetical protein
MLLRRIALLFFLSVPLYSLLAQVTIQGDLTVSSGGLMTFSDSVSNQGSLQVEGSVIFEGDVQNEGTFLAENGTVRFLGTEQIVSSTEPLAVNAAVIETSDLLSIEAGLNIKELLTLEQGVLVADTVVLLPEAGIIQNNDDSYIVGTLSRSGADSLYFPVGSLLQPRPVAISEVSIAAPIAISFSANSPEGEAGKGLLSVSENGFWNISAEEEVLGKVHVYAEPNTSENTALASARGGGNVFSRVGLYDGSPWISSDVPIYAGRLTFGQFFDEQLRVADSLKLVSLYQSTGGEQWLNRDQWLISGLDNWRGVSLESKRVVALSLPDNNLKEAVDFSGDGLEKMIQANLQGNEIEEISGFSDTGLSTLDVSQNRLQFGSIEEALDGGIAVEYELQKRVLDSIRVINEIGAGYLLDRTVSGVQNQYAWFRNDEPVDSVGSLLQLAFSSFDDEAAYFAEVTSANVPGLVLRTQPVIVLVSSIERDSAALINLYEKMDGENWQGVSDWRGLPIAAWDEVVLEENRVKEVLLSNLGLRGELPFDITDVTELETLDVSNNSIENLPVLSSLQQLTAVDVSNNKLGFDDLQLNQALTSVMTYAPQQRFGEVDTIQYEVGSPGALSYSVGGLGNSYQWLRDDLLVEGATSSSLTIQSVDYETMGDYVLTVSNDDYPNLSLSSQPLSLEATSSISIQPFYTDFDNESNQLEEGMAYLFRVRESGQPYDSVDQVSVTDGEVRFQNVVLDDYILVVSSDQTFEEVVDGQQATLELLPTYFENSIDWVDADTIQLRAAFTDSLFVENLVTGLESGTGTVDLLVESEFIRSSTNGRIEARRKVRKAGCSLRRNSQVSGGREEDDEEWVLVAYQETDDEGQVNFGFLPQGLYRLNIQYPGIPMDPDSFIEFEISEEEEMNGYQLNALITEEAITVTLQEVLALTKNYFDDLMVFPVPADQSVNIRYEALKRDHVAARLVDMQGKVLTEKMLPPGLEGSHSFDVADVADGVYLLHLTDVSEKGKMLVTVKVVIRHNQ